MYQTIFLGLFYSCNNFGHKAARCRSYDKQIRNYKGYSNNSYLRKSHETKNKNHNSCCSLSNEIEFYKCNNFGHMDKYCRMNVPTQEPKHNINSHNQEPKRIWRIKQDQFNTEECSLSLQVEYKKSGWYVDNGCSKHMKSDKIRFLTLKKEQDGSISFGNHNSSIIIGRGTVKLGSEDAKA
jgi:hypothetical protein